MPQARFALKRIWGIEDSAPATPGVRPSRRYDRPKPHNRRSTDVPRHHAVGGLCARRDVTLLKHLAVRNGSGLQALFSQNL
jgi:hypothetical protein